MITKNTYSLIGKLGISLFLAALALTGCNSVASETSHSEASKLSFPQYLGKSEDNNRLIDIYSKVTLKRFGDEVCLFAGDGKDLVIFDKKATVTNIDPLTIKIGETEIKSGEKINFPGLFPITGGYDCGGKHWEKAYHTSEYFK